MSTSNEKIVILCHHHGVLLNYSILLNQLNHYNLSLCSSTDEALRSLKKTKHVRFFIFDQFELNRDNKKDIIRLSNEKKIKNFLFTGCLPPSSRSLVYRWAKSKDIPLRKVLKTPISLLELKTFLTPNTSHK